MFRSKPVAALLAALVLVAPAFAFGGQDEKVKKEAEEISKAVGKAMSVFETDNFTWCASKSESSLSTVTRAAEKAFEEFAKQADVASWRDLWGDQKTMIVILSSGADYKRYIKWYADNHQVWDKDAFVANTSKVDWFNVVQTRRVICTHFKPHDESYIAQIVAYQVGWLAANRLHFEANFVPPWLEEGTATWTEIEATDKLQCCTTRSTLGATPFKITDRPSDILDKFRKLTKDNVKKKRLRPVKSLMKQRSWEMTLEDLETSYALVDWMMAQKKYSAFVRAMRKHWPADIKFEFTEEQAAAQEKAFKEVFDKSLAQIDEAVGEHATKNY